MQHRNDGDTPCAPTKVRQLPRQGELTPKHQLELLKVFMRNSRREPVAFAVMDVVGMILLANWLPWWQPAIWLALALPLLGVDARFRRRFEQIYGLEDPASHRGLTSSEPPPPHGGRLDRVGWWVNAVTATSLAHHVLWCSTLFWAGAASAELRVFLVLVVVSSLGMRALVNSPLPQLCGAVVGVHAIAIIAVGLLQGTLFFYAVAGLGLLWSARALGMSRAHHRKLRAQVVLHEELRYAVQYAEDANAAKTLVLDSMSHEIRTPMNGILGVLELMRRDGLESKQDELASLGQQSAEDLLLILNQIMDLSQIDAAQLELYPEAVETRRIVSAVTASVSPKAGTKGIALSVEIAPEVPEMIRVDVLRLRQILTNVVVGAITFTVEGHVRLSVRVDGVAEDGLACRLVFKVSGCGVGLCDRTLEAMFNPSTEVDPSAAHLGGSGLSSFKELVRLMDGIVRVEECVQGSVVAVELPVPVVSSTDPVALSPEPWSLDEVSEPLRHTAALQVMVVDDHPINRRILHSQLSSLGWDAHLYEDGAQAFRAFVEGHYAVVLTDYHMPEMNGLELAQ
ncbi:MAG: histidine kinase dimerization/phospho-acceptor domain-containing protein, partial [Myxococcota bacterium]